MTDEKMDSERKEQLRSLREHYTIPSGKRCVAEHHLKTIERLWPSAPDSTKLDLLKDALMFLLRQVQ